MAYLAIMGRSLVSSGLQDSLVALPSGNPFIEVVSIPFVDEGGANKKYWDASLKKECPPELSTFLDSMADVQTVCLHLKIANSLDGISTGNPKNKFLDMLELLHDYASSPVYCVIAYEDADSRVTRLRKESKGVLRNFSMFRVATTLKRKVSDPVVLVSTLILPEGVEEAVKTVEEDKWFVLWKEKSPGFRMYMALNGKFEATLGDQSVFSPTHRIKVFKRIDPLFGKKNSKNLVEVEVAGDNVTLKKS